MKTNSPEQIFDFEQLKRNIVIEKLTILNNEKQRFADMCDRMKNAQDEYNKSLLFTYDMYSALPKHDRIITKESQIMTKAFAKHYPIGSEQQTNEQIKNSLNEAVMFLYSHYFDIELEKTDREKLKQHLEFLKDLRSIINQNLNNMVLDVIPKDENWIMTADLYNVMLICHEFLLTLDDWTQIAEDEFENKMIAEEMYQAYHRLEELTRTIQQTETVSNEQRNEIRSIMKHYSKLMNLELNN